MVKIAFIIIVAVGIINFIAFAINDYIFALRTVVVAIDATNEAAYKIAFSRIIDYPVKFVSHKVGPQFEVDIFYITLRKKHAVRMYNELRAIKEIEVCLT